MAKKKRNDSPAPQIAKAVSRPAAPVQRMDPRLWGIVPALVLGFFLLTCMTVDDTIKTLALVMVAAAVVSCAIRFPVLRERVSLPLVGVGAWVVMNGISTFYALSGKFALREFLKLLVGLCVFLLILCWTKKDQHPGRAAAAMLSGGTALASLISIDMISTHWISGPVVWVLSLFSQDFTAIADDPLEVGVRITSLYENPNVFAGAAGLGVLLALGLAVSSEDTRQRCFHLVCLFLNSLAFVLAFSMGASGMIALAFLVYLIVERRRRGTLLFVMVETLVLAVLCAFPIFLTSFDAWDGFQPVPLLCAILGSAALCALDLFVGHRVGAALERHGKVLALSVVGILALLCVFAAAAMNVTGAQHVAAGERLRRADYPQPGTYTLSIAASGAELSGDDVRVSIESQNQEETMMHTGTMLYDGPAQGAAFTVPEDSLVVYFNFTSATDVTLQEATYSGEAGEGSLKLGYKLLPGFIANRLQGLFANENAIQRAVFFADGLKLFRRSPVVGLGMGAFESALRSVQSFDYETKFTHNHYIETLINVGVVGLILFLAALGLCAVALIRNLLHREQTHPLTPALTAALVFMMGHAAVEVVFSFSFYLPLALGIFALICLCCGHELPIPGKEQIRGGIVMALAGLIVVFTAFLVLNMHMRDTVTKGNYTNFYDALEMGAALDRFERFDYMLSYINNARTLNPETNRDVYEQAKKFADELATKDSNTIPPHLAEFYFITGETERGYAMLDKYVDYLPAVDECWQTTFNILSAYHQDTPEHTAQVQHFYQLFQDWNAEHMGTVSLSDVNKTYLEMVLGEQ